MAAAAAALAPEQLLAGSGIAGGLFGVALCGRADVGDDAPDVFLAQPDGERGHLGAWGSVRNDVKQIGVTLADRIDTARQVRSAPPFGADAMAWRAINAKGPASGFGGAGVVLEGILWRSLPQGQAGK